MSAGGGRERLEAVVLFPRPGVYAVTIRPDAEGFHEPVLTEEFASRKEAEYRRDRLRVALAAPSTEGEPAECDACDGQGEVAQPTSVPGDDGWTRCMICGGSGDLITGEEVAALRTAMEVAQEQASVLSREVRRVVGRPDDRDPYSLAHHLSRRAPSTGEGEAVEWQVERGVTCVVCPDCAFIFDAGHRDSTGGGYSCPNCASTGASPLKRDAYVVRVPRFVTPRNVRRVRLDLVQEFGQLRLASPPEGVAASMGEDAESYRKGYEAAKKDSIRRGEEVLCGLCRDRLGVASGAGEDAEWLRSLASDMGCGCSSCEEGIPCFEGAEANKEAERLRGIAARLAHPGAGESDG